MEKTKKIELKDAMLMLLFVAAATGIGVWLRIMGLHKTNIVVVYILSVLLTARYTRGYMEGIFASILSVLAFNWFFTEPFYTLKVNDLTYLITFFTMATTSISTSALTSKLKKVAAEAREKEAESNALYQLTNHLTDAEDIWDIALIMVKTVSGILPGYAACICFDENGEPESTFIQQKEDGEQVRRELENREELKQRLESLHAPYDRGKEFCDWPIYGRNSILGALRIPSSSMENITEAQSRMLLSVIESTALAMERFRSLQVQAKSREEMEQERYRSNLLRAISHDIRTPLSGIMGSSEMLMQMTEKEDPRFELSEDIYRDADWLHSLVENILSLTRLQDGGMMLEKEPEAVEEVVGAAIATMDKRAPGREILVQMPDSFLMVPMNARLIHQVLINLLDNAVIHSPGDSSIMIVVEVEQEEHQVRFTVLDHGCGIVEEDKTRIFQMFYTTRGKSADSQRGIGLGLAICQSIIEAHGGTIRAENRLDKRGAEFIFTLPMGDEEE